MAKKDRKRMIAGKLYDPQSAEYWNRILSTEDLSVEAGRDPRLIPIGNSNDLETLERTRSTNGRKMPHKQAE
jgi:hypothetical protein